MLNCSICYGVKFFNWIEYHDHYEEHHRGNVWQTDDDFKAIRLKAIATPLNVTGRIKKQIVDDVEENTWLREYLIY